MQAWVRPKELFLKDYQYSPLPRVLKVSFAEWELDRAELDSKGERVAVYMVGKEDGRSSPSCSWGFTSRNPLASPGPFSLGFFACKEPSSESQDMKIKLPSSSPQYPFLSTANITFLPWLEQREQPGLLGHLTRNTCPSSTAPLDMWCQGKGSIVQGPQLTYPTVLDKRCDVPPLTGVSVVLSFFRSTDPAAEQPTRLQQGMGGLLQETE